MMGPLGWRDRNYGCLPSSDVPGLYEWGTVMKFGHVPYCFVRQILVYDEVREYKSCKLASPTNILENMVMKFLCRPPDSFMSYER